VEGNFIKVAVGSGKHLFIVQTGDEESIKMVEIVNNFNTTFSYGKNITLDRNKVFLDSISGENLLTFSETFPEFSSLEKLYRIDTKFLEIPPLGALPDDNPERIVYVNVPAQEKRIGFPVLPDEAAWKPGESLKLFCENSHPRGILNLRVFLRNGGDVQMNIPHWHGSGMEFNFDCRVRRNKEDAWRDLRPAVTTSGISTVTEPSIAVGETREYSGRFLLDVPVGDYEIEVGLANRSMNILPTDRKIIEVTEGEVDVERIFHKQVL
jgi:hypothetical protein